MTLSVDRLPHFKVPKMTGVDKEVSPGDLRFTQDSIAQKFKRENTTLDSAVTMLRAGQLSPAQFGKLVVVNHGGLLWSVNNRRLWVFRQAGVPRVNVILLTSSSEDGLQAVINSSGNRGRGKLSKIGKENLQRLIDNPAHMTKLGAADFLPRMRGKPRMQAPSNNQQFEHVTVQIRNTTSSKLPTPNPVQPNHASVNASTMTQPQSRLPQDRGSTSTLKQENVKRLWVPVEPVPILTRGEAGRGCGTFMQLQSLQVPSNNQQYEHVTVQIRNTTSSKLPTPNHVQPNHASANASTMTQPQSRLPQDQGSTSTLKQENVKRLWVPVEPVPILTRGEAGRGCGTFMQLQSLQVPSNNQQFEHVTVQIRNTTSSKLPTPNPVQPNHASANTSTMIQPQSSPRAFEPFFPIMTREKRRRCGTTVWDHFLRLFCWLL